jgi:hypothetical protein
MKNKILLGWFRLFDIGLKWKDISIHKLMFSERIIESQIN